MRLSSINHQGFTLLELIVVMVLIAITVTLTVPKISNFIYTDQLKVAVRKLVGLINQSSQLAQRNQAPYLLRYIEGEQRFVVEPEQQKEDETKTFFKESKEIKERGLRLAESVKVKDCWSWYGGIRTTAEFSIRFTKNGYVEPTIIHLREDGGREISVVLSPFLGKVQVVDRYVTPEKDAFFQ
ncbi:MAG: type II secretion system protein [Desulfobulbaceae bacterium]|nr:type II secretion system protein [Desulfobulbaceae bacterium]